MLPDPLRDLVVSEAELLGEPFEAAGFFDGIEVRALKVLDQAQHELRIAAGVMAHNSGYRLEAGKPCRTPSPLAGDELVAVDRPENEERLQHAVLPDRLCEFTQRLGVETRADLLMRGPDLIDRDHLRHHRLTLA
jgi:hypothetical protein